MAIFTVSTRWIDSGGARGCYDNVIALYNASQSEAVEFLGLNVISGFSSIQLKTNSSDPEEFGLNNTLIVSGTIAEGTTIEVSLAQRGEPFKADVTLSGNVTASLAGFDVDFASFEMGSDTVRLTIATETITYNKSNLQELKADLMEVGVD